MDYKIEEAIFEDLDAIHELIYDRCLWFSKKGVKGWNIDFYPNKYDKEYFLKQMKINKLFVAKCNNCICGVMLLKDKDEDYWNDDIPSYYIHHLATDKNIKGIGKKLLEYAEKQCKKDNKKYLRLDCYKESAFLNDYYLKSGFTYVGNGQQDDYNYNLWEMKI